MAQWQNRANRLTEEIIGDSSSASESERAIYFALLAKMWWQRKPDDAKAYVRRAVDLTMNSIEFDDGVQFRKEAENWRRTLYVLASFDRVTSRALAVSMLKELKKKRYLGGANADAAVVTALQLVDSDPRLALALGEKSLVYGVSPLFHILALRLGEKDPKLGQDLIRLAFNSTPGALRYEFLGDITSVFAVVNGQPVLEVNQRGYSRLLADLFAAAAGSELEMEARCEIAPLVVPWLRTIGLYAAERASIVRQSIETCVPAFDPFLAEAIRAEIDNDGPDDVDDLLRSARNAGDAFVKAHYYYLAVQNLANEEKFDEIISMLDGMDDDKRIISQTVWNGWRIEYAYRAALKDIRDNDIPSAYRVVDRTPANIRPFVRFRLINEIQPGEYKDFVLENLESTGKELGSFAIREKIAARGYLWLTRLYFRFKPSDAQEAFAQAIKYINKVDRDNSDFLPEKDYAPFRDYVSLPADLLLDESSTYSSLSNISSRRSRVRLKLGLLESVLNSPVN